MDLVAVAGGLSTKPVRISGRVVRAGKVIPFSVEQAVARPASAANVLLKPDDLVVLDQQDITRQVHVIGQVSRPGAYDLEEGLTPVSLIAETGGATESAVLSKAYVLRGAAQIPMDLQAVLVYGKDNPTITRFRFLPGDVLVVPENQSRYSIMGQVAKPGYYSLSDKQGEATVLKALATAGGQLLDSDLSKASVTRTVNGQSTVIPVNIEAMIKGTAPDDVVLRPDDVLYIPQSPNPQVHVIGKVNKPGAYDLKEGFTLMSLVAEAGSSSAGAGLSKAYILRNGTQMPVDLHAALIEGKPDAALTNFKLQNGDVLVVPDVSNQINVIGQVNKQGVYDLDDSLTAASLIGQAGGVVADKAALSQSNVMRQGNKIPLNLQAILGGTADVALMSFKFQPGDVLVVPESQVRYAVLGQVNKPGYYSYPEKKGEATVLKALSEAGGQAANSDLSKAGIVRTVNGQAISIPININEMLRKGGPGSQVELQPGDILYIPAVKEKTSILPFLLGPIASLLRGGL
jgi:protein involved in polysaccharide export with SLBB domain